MSRLTILIFILFSSLTGMHAQTFTVNGVSFNMIYVEGGTFKMGSSAWDSEAYENECPAHKVTLSSYMIGQTEVTQELWQAVMGDNPSDYHVYPTCPVEEVSWDDCQEFINKLNALTGQQFRLPTEAEWEFAARGGNKSKGYKYSGSKKIKDVGWYWQNSGDKYLPGDDSNWNPDRIDANHCRHHMVATKAPNELGIFDMSGNVWEWCQDFYSIYKKDPQTNPTGPSRGNNHVFRGGCWNGDARFCRVTTRFRTHPSIRYDYLGMRLAM